MTKCPLSHPPLTPRWPCSYVPFALRCLDVGFTSNICIFFFLKKFEVKEQAFSGWDLVV